MNVGIRFFAGLREITGTWTTELELPRQADVNELLRALARTYGKRFTEYVYEPSGRVREHLIFLVNGESIHSRQGFATDLTNGDILVILPPVGGG